MGTGEITDRDPGHGSMGTVLNGKEDTSRLQEEGARIMSVSMEIFQVKSWSDLLSSCLERKGASLEAIMAGDREPAGQLCHPIDSLRL